MTNLAELFEIENKKQNEQIPSRKKYMKEIGISSGIGYGILISLPLIFPEIAPELQEIPKLEYLQISAAASPFFIGIMVGVGAIKPELYKVGNYLAYKPFALLGKGIDYISNRKNSN